MRICISDIHPGWRNSEKFWQAMLVLTNNDSGCVGELASGLLFADENGAVLLVGVSETTQGG